MKAWHENGTGLSGKWRVCVVFCLSCVRMQQLAAGSAVFDRPICMVTLFMKSRIFAAENQGKSKK